MLRAYRPHLPRCFVPSVRLAPWDGAWECHRSIAALEERALASGATTVTLGVFGEDETVSQATHDRYERIRDTVGLTAMFSGGFTESPVPGVRTGVVDASDPMRNEHGVVVVGPDWSGLVAASKRNDRSSAAAAMTALVWQSAS